jgi:holo-[acyl-carrier protein] synthase
MRLMGPAAERLAELVPTGMKPQIDVSLTDDPPLAQAIVIISAVKDDGAGVD